jgi:hypothetical protein
VHDISLFGLPTAGHGGSIEASFGKAGVPSVHVGGVLRHPAVHNVTLGQTTDNPRCANPDLNEGTVKIEIKTAAGASAAPFPTASSPTATTAAISGMGSAATIGAAERGSLHLHGVRHDGRHRGSVRGHHRGAGIGTALPIVNVPAAMTLIVASLTGAAPPGTTGAWITAAGLGPCRARRRRSSSPTTRP